MKACTFMLSFQDTEATKMKFFLYSHVVEDVSNYLIDLYWFLVAKSMIYSRAMAKFTQPPALVFIIYSILFLHYSVSLIIQTG